MPCDERSKRGGTRLRGSRMGSRVMPRKLLLQFEGAIYHVMSRGNARQGLQGSLGHQFRPISMIADANGDLGCPRTLPREVA